MIKLTSVLAGLVVSAGLAPVSAQDLIPVTSVKYAGRYDLATDTFFPSDVDPDLSAGDSTPAVLYDNTATNTFFTTANVVNNHLMDWGTPGFGGSGATISEVRLGWATSLQAPNVVGLRFRLYEGATGNGTQGTIVGDYVLTNLPTSVSGNPEGYTLDVTLPSPLSLPDGAFGWSYNADNPVGAPAASSGPLLVGPPNALGAGPDHGPAFGSYDRYSEATNTYISTVTGTVAPMRSFVMRLKGRSNNPPPQAWANFGVASGIVLQGTGSATPGSTDNNIHISATPSGKNVIVVAGVSQADFFKASLGLHFYAHPWLMELAPMQTPLLSGDLDLPATLPVTLLPGDQIYLQVFGQNLSGAYKKWSAGLELTIQ